LPVPIGQPVGPGASDCGQAAIADAPVGRM
jgi:hypothetical protein